ncbi:transcriptional regulator [Marinobacter fuscus]|uniref:Transcriptional regulator n=1 Tax=Marinobacter fuscus TaxID=2109942 RepID=A0A2T1KPZ9_9GAMM|nr:nuclear transport factor 2 family protein [Marinobacter fuscus]PSF12229.1 transcriptional regulator [Marinobacter fuscus]
MKTPASAIEVGAADSGLSVALEKFQSLFNELDQGNLAKLQQVYSEDIVFQDPFGEVRGLDDLTEYMAAAYKNVNTCKFRFTMPVIQDCWCSLPWVMELSHKRIRGGKIVLVNGISHLEIRDGKVRYHRDYFDAGQLLYENLPIVGGVIRWVKEKAG